LKRRKNASSGLTAMTKNAHTFIPMNDVQDGQNANSELSVYSSIQQSHVNLEKAAQDLTVFLIIPTKGRKIMIITNNIYN